VYPVFENEPGDGEPPAARPWPILVAAVGGFFAMRAYSWATEELGWQIFFLANSWAILIAGLIYFFRARSRSDG
jgi:hypothetical protein